MAKKQQKANPKAQADKGDKKVEKNTKKIEKRVQKPKAKAAARNYFTVQEDNTILESIKKGGEKTKFETAKDLADRLGRTTEAVRDRIKRYLAKLAANDQKDIAKYAKSNPKHFAYFKKNPDGSRKLEKVAAASPSLQNREFKRKVRVPKVKKETKKSLNANGVTEALYAAYTPGERDYSAIVSRMKQAGINVIYVGGYHTETGLIARQAKEQGMNVTMVGGDALVTNEFWQIAGPAGENTLMTFPSDPRKRPTAASVVNEFKAKGIDPEGYTLYTYGAIQIWAEAAKKANSIDGKKVADVLHDGQPWNSVLGPISFDKKGDITTADYVFYVWKNGNYSEL